MATTLESAYRGRRVFVTGHTGFKGSWLSLWLGRLGAEVSGYALAPDTEPSHFELLGLEHASTLGDLRDRDALSRALIEARPEVVFHLAAQPLVLRSYEDPVETFETNVLGSAHLLEACRATESVRAVVFITTDKCYENREWVYGYRESDPLGGHDPYSASKACSELVAASYRRSFFQAPGGSGALLATARAGNVIGGGDWAANRLVPDIMRAAAAGQAVRLRNPSSSRPWQHVLEPLSGYLVLGAGLLEGRTELAEAWNFGPDLRSNLTTAELFERMQRAWGEVRCEIASEAQAPHEAGLLMLDSTKAKRALAWAPVWDIDATLRATAEWYRAHHEDRAVISGEQIDEYVRCAWEQGLDWAG